MKTKTTTIISSEKVRNLCVENGYYTDGSNYEYSELLNVLCDKKYTDTRLVAIMRDIVKHTDIDACFTNCNNDEIYEILAYQIANNCTTSKIEIEF